MTQNRTLSIPQDSLLTLFLKNAKGTKVVYKNLSVKNLHPGEKSGEMEHYGLPGGMFCWLECSIYLGMQVY